MTHRAALLQFAVASVVSLFIAGGIGASGTMLCMTGRPVFLVILVANILLLAWAIHLMRRGLSLLVTFVLIEDQAAERAWSGGGA